MPASRAPKSVLPSLVMVWVGSCAVFPDHAELPLSANAGAGGEAIGGAAGAGAAVQAGEGDGGGLVQAGASSATGGTGGAGGAGPEPTAGGAGAGCASTERSLVVVADTWIESAKPSTAHGNEPTLLVVGAADERRALLSFSLPAAPPGSSLVRGLLRLHLESNADAALVERQLEVYLLEQVIDESRTTWSNYGNGASQRWVKAGGDFGVALASATVPALAEAGPLTFDLTADLAEMFATVAVAVPLIVLEVGPEPIPPAELAFTSREGDASGAPQLVIEYCP